MNLKTKYSVVYIQHGEIQRFHTNKLMLALQLRAKLKRMGIDCTIAEVLG